MTIAFGNVAVGGLPAGLLPQWLRSTDSKGWALTGRFPCPGRSAALAFVCRRTFAPRRTLQVGPRLALANGLPSVSWAHCAGLPTLALREVLFRMDGYPPLR